MLRGFLLLLYGHTIELPLHVTVWGQEDIPVDTIGIPLMRVNCNLCVHKGLIVVIKGSEAACHIVEVCYSVPNASLCMPLNDA